MIHTHSICAVMATLLTEGREFKVSNLEMIKGIKMETEGERVYGFGDGKWVVYGGWMG